MSKVRAVNGFTIRRFIRGNIRGIIVVYMIDNEYYSWSRYCNVDEEKIQKVKEKLEDYTSTNREAEELCRTISLKSIREEVDRIIFDNWKTRIVRRKRNQKNFGSFFD